MSQSLINTVFNESLNYLEKMPKTKRKAIGQFFTSAETAIYMASMFSCPKKENLSILDPGSGSGILTAAVVDRLQNECIPLVKHIQITCYETSKDVLPILKKNLEYIKKSSSILVDYEVIEENYITSQSNDFNNTVRTNSDSSRFDLIICNPPYRKLMKNSVEATSMPSLCHGAPNLYFLFTAMGLFNLNKNGEMVVIIPRSWTSGVYFQKFRDYLFKTGTLKQIHLFVSRNKVFEKENVLQEIIIIKMDKSGKNDSVKITCSNSNSDFNNISSIEIPYSDIVVGPEKYVYLVTSNAELNVLQTLGRWKNTLPSIGLKMRTGLTIDFRNREYLKNESENETVPLLYPEHIKEGRVVFPVQRKFEYITTDKKGLLQRNKNYLIVKRFTTKEEKRRLQCGIYLSSNFPEYNQISTQNKVNFIEGIDFDMKKEQVYGLYVLFNSTIYDQYYRILNGSTQVNSTEVNAMPVLTLSEIEYLGSKLEQRNSLSVDICDEILGEFINK